MSVYLCTYIPILLLFTCFPCKYLYCKLQSLEYTYIYAREGSLYSIYVYGNNLLHITQHMIDSAYAIC